MACCVLRLSQRDRERYSRMFTSFSVITAILCLLLLIDSIYVINKVSPSLHTEKAVIILIFTIIMMLVMQLLIYYLAGIFVCYKCHRNAHKKHSRYLLKIWTFSGYSSVINVVIIGAMAGGVSNHIVRSMHHSMERGMKNYLKDIHWKKIIDSLQFRMQCCGSNSYKDWHSISWMSTSHFKSNSDIIKDRYKISGERIYIPAVPWSCCKLDYPKQCFHDPVQQYRSLDFWEQPTVRESIYDIGCVEMLRQPIEYSFVLFIIGSYLLLILQIILSIISRYLYTSYRNSVILGDPHGVAPGWIIGRGDCGLNYGPTASEVMLGKSGREPKNTGKTHLSSLEIITPERVSDDTRESRKKNETPEESDDENYRITTEDEEALLLK